MLSVPPHQRLIQHLDDWLALKDLCYESQAQNFRLRNFMYILLKGQPHHDRLQVMPHATKPLPVVIVGLLYEGCFNS